MLTKSLCSLLCKQDFECSNGIYIPAPRRTRAPCAGASRRGRHPAGMQFNRHSREGPKPVPNHGWSSETCLRVCRVEQKGAKFGEGSSIMAIWLCVGNPRLVDRRNAGNSNMQELFCPILQSSNLFLTHTLNPLP